MPAVGAATGPVAVDETAAEDVDTVVSVVEDSKELVFNVELYGEAILL